MKKACTIFSGLMLIFSGWVIYLSMGLKKSIIDYDIGPAAYPQLICAVLILLSVLLVVVECNRKREDEPITFLRLNNVVHIAFVFAFLAALQPVGFPICAFLIIAVMMKIMGCPKVWQIVAFSAAASTFVYVVFKVLLKVRLPLGLLELFF